MINSLRMLPDCSFAVETIWQTKKTCIHDNKSYDGLRGYFIARSLARNIFNIFSHLCTMYVAHFSNTNQIVLKNSKNIL